MRLQWRLHRLIWDMSGGRLGRRVRGMPVLELVTTGYRSGESRSILITYLPTDAGPALAGTNAGLEQDPAWVKNLRATPRARMRRDGAWSDVEVGFLEGAEWARVWGRFRQERGYSDYEEILERPIPIVVLRSVTEGSPRR